MADMPVGERASESGATLIAPPPCEIIRSRASQDSTAWRHLEDFVHAVTSSNWRNAHAATPPTALPPRGLITTSRTLLPSPAEEEAARRPANAKTRPAADKAMVRLSGSAHLPWSTCMRHMKRRLAVAHQEQQQHNTTCCFPPGHFQLWQHKAPERLRRVATRNARAALATAPERQGPSRTIGVTADDRRAFCHASNPHKEPTTTTTLEWRAITGRDTPQAPLGRNSGARGAARAPLAAPVGRRLAASCPPLLGCASRARAPLGRRLGATAFGGALKSGLPGPIDSPTWPSTGYGVKDAAKIRGASMDA